jgi:hypothetical protein
MDLPRSSYIERNVKEKIMVSTRIAHEMKNWKHQQLTSSVRTSENHRNTRMLHWIKSSRSKKFEIIPLNWWTSGHEFSKILASLWSMNVMEVTG